jgi:hypothetical protein
MTPITIYRKVGNAVHQLYTPAYSHMADWKGCEVFVNWKGCEIFVTHLLLLGGFLYDMYCS